MGNLNVFSLRQKCRAPIEYGVTNRVNKKVRDGNNPDVLVAKDVIDDEFLELLIGFAFL